MKWVKVVIRMGIVLAISLIGLAIGVARLVPSVESASTSARRPPHSEYVEINNYSLPDDTRCRLLDPQTGNVVSMNLGGSDSLLFARSAPWEDEKGETEVVGRWVSRGIGYWDGPIQEVGLARVRFPSGKVLDQIPLEIVPSGNPCWLRGATSRVVYSGTDGQLYRIEFPSGPVASGDPAEVRPEIVTWHCPEPGSGGVRVGDPVCPSDPRMKGRLVVSLTYVERIDGKSNYVPEQIWWLELDPEGRHVLAAGRLSNSRFPVNEAVQERLPSVATTADNTMVLAYLCRPKGQSTWDLHLAPVVFGNRTGALRARTRSSIKLASNVVVTFPAFSADGQWVHGIRLPVHSLAHAERFSVAGALTDRLDGILSWQSETGRSPLRRRPSDMNPRGARSDRSRNKS